jgi:hypothetical protein
MARSLAGYAGEAGGVSGLKCRRPPEDDHELSNDCWLSC